MDRQQRFEALTAIPEAAAIRLAERMLADAPGVIAVITPPTVGMVMARAVDGAQGETFNLGEVLVTEARVSIDGHEGWGMVLGRAPDHAMSVAVVDAGDQLVAFARMDGADLVGVRLAQDKAYTALVNRMPTRDLAPLVQPGTEFYGYDSVAGGRMIVFAGGMPVERNGVLVGAIGVSGGSADEDQRAVDAAVEAFGSG